MLFLKPFSLTNFLAAQVVLWDGDGESLQYHSAEACQEHLAILVSLGHNNSILVILGLDFLRCSARVLPVLGKEELYELFH